MGNNVRPDIGSHDQDAIAEINVTAKAVGQLALLHDLQKHIEDIMMGLLDLVEEHDGVGAPANLFRQLAAFLETNVTRRSSNQPRDVVLLHVLRHVDLDKRIFLAKNEFGESLGQECLTNARRTQEDKGPHRTQRIFEAGPRPPNRLGDRSDGAVL